MGRSASRQDPIDFRLTCVVERLCLPAWHAIEFVTPVSRRKGRPSGLAVLARVPARGSRDYRAWRAGAGHVKDGAGSLFRPYPMRAKVSREEDATAPRRSPRGVSWSRKPLG